MTSANQQGNSRPFPPQPTRKKAQKEAGLPDEENREPQTNSGASILKRMAKGKQVTSETSPKFQHPTIDFTDMEKTMIVALHAWCTSEIGNRLRATGKPLPDAEARRKISMQLQDVIAVVVFELRDREGIPPNTEWLELVGGLVDGALYHHCESPEERRERIRRVN